MDTKTTILDTAEKLFAEQGFDAASLRAITAEADVNIAAINYHFGSKDNLIKAVFARRLQPLNQERLRILDSLEAKGTPSLEAVLEAFAGPPLRLSRDESGSGEMFMRLLGRTLGETNNLITGIFKEQFGEVARRFQSAFSRALPNLPPTNLFWRMHFMIGAMAHTMADRSRLEILSAGKCDASDIEEALRQLVPFLAGGMSAAPCTDSKDQIS